MLIGIDIKSKSIEDTMNYYNLRQEYRTLRTLIATKYQENYE